MKQEIKFTPEKSFLEFAQWFSLHYKKLPAGLYHSDPLGYSIRYVDRFLDDEGNVKTKTIARVGHKTGVIELDRIALKDKKLTGDYVFYMIMWCAIKKKLLVDWSVSDDLEADRLSIQYYSESQPHRSKKDVVCGWLVQLKRSGDKYGLSDRCDEIKRQLLKAQKSEPNLKVMKLKSKKKKS